MWPLRPAVDDLLTRLAPVTIYNRIDTTDNEWFLIPTNRPVFFQAGQGQGHRLSIALSSDSLL
jgi:hypothetical protein